MLVTLENSGDWNSGNKNSGRLFNEKINFTTFANST